MKLPFNVLDFFKVWAMLPAWFWLLVFAPVLFEVAKKLIEDYFDGLRFARAGLKDLKRMSGEDFEKYLEHLFRGLGYKVRRTPYQGDYGVDLIVEAPDGTRCAVQAKRWRQRVGAEVVQQVVGGSVYYGCNRTMIVTTSGYTDRAKAMARKTGTQLWGLKELGDCMDKLKTKRATQTDRVRVEGEQTRFVGAQTRKKVP